MLPALPAASYSDCPLRLFNGSLLRYESWKMIRDRAAASSWKVQRQLIEFVLAGIGSFMMLMTVHAQFSYLAFAIAKMPTNSGVQQ